MSSFVEESTKHNVRNHEHTGFLSEYFLRYKNFLLIHANMKMNFRNIENRN